MITTAVLAGASAQSQDPAAEAVATVRAVFDAMRSNDSSAARPFFHPKARLITAAMRNGAPAVQVEESADAFIQAIGTPRTEVWDERLSNERVHLDGPLASVWADYSFYRGGTFSHCGVDHFLLVRESGRWQIIEVADTRRTEGCGPLEARGQRP